MKQYYHSTHIATLHPQPHLNLIYYNGIVQGVTL